MKLIPLPDSHGCPAALSPDGRYVAATPVDGQKLLIFEVATQKWSELVKSNVSFSPGQPTASTCISTRNLTWSRGSIVYALLTTSWSRLQA